MPIRESVVLEIDSTAAVRGGQRFETTMDGVTRAVKRTDSSITKLTQQGGRDLRNLGQNLRGLLLAAGAGVGFAQATRTIAGFEEAIARLGAVSGTMATPALDQLAATARELGASTQFTASEAAQGLTFLAQAGFSANEQLAAIGPTLDLAVAGNLDLAQSADLASNVLSGFSLAAEETARVVDVLANTAFSSNTSVAQLGEALKFVAPVAGAVGRSVEETAAALGVLGDAGIQASLAGTNLRGIISALLRPTGEAKDTIDDLGFSLQDLDPSTRSLGAIFRQFADANLSAADAVAIFGRRNAAAALVLTANIDKVGELTAANEAAAGTAARVADAIEDTLAGAFRAFLSAIEEVTLSAGDAGLLGVMRSIVDDATLLARALGGDTSQLREVSTTAIIASGAIAGLVAQFTAVRVAGFAAAIFQGTQALIAFVRGLGTARAGVRALGISAQAAAGPIGLVVGIITAIGAEAAIAATATSEFSTELSKIQTESRSLVDDLERLVDQEQTYARVLRDGNRELADRLALTRSANIARVQEAIASATPAPVDPDEVRVATFDLTRGAAGFRRETAAETARQFGELTDIGFALTALRGELDELTAARDRFNAEGLDFAELQVLPQIERAIAETTRSIDSLSRSLETNAVSSFRNTAVVGGDLLDQLRRLPGASDAVTDAIRRFQAQTGLTVQAAFRNDVDRIVQEALEQARQVEGAIRSTGQAGSEAASGIGAAGNATAAAGNAAGSAAAQYRAFAAAVEAAAAAQRDATAASQAARAEGEAADRDAASRATVPTGPSLPSPPRGRFEVEFAPPPGPPGRDIPGDLPPRDLSLDELLAQQRTLRRARENLREGDGAEAGSDEVRTVRIAEDSQVGLGERVAFGISRTVNQGLKDAIRGEFDPGEFAEQMSLAFGDAAIDFFTDQLFSSLDPSQQRNIAANERTANAVERIAASPGVQGTGGGGLGGGSGGAGFLGLAQQAGIALALTGVAIALERSERRRERNRPSEEGRSTVNVQLNTGASTNDVLRSLRQYRRDQARTTYFSRNDRVV